MGTSLKSSGLRIFEEGRTPSGWGLLLAQWAGAVALFGLGVLLLLVQFVRRRTA